MHGCGEWPRHLPSTRFASVRARHEQRDKYISFVEDRPFNDCRYHIDSTKLNRLGWSPTIAFKDGIAKTVEWYRKNLYNWESVAQ